jgi:hypothetical protein
MAVNSAALFLSQRYPAVIFATPGIVSFWRLNEPSGSVAADLIAARNGTYTASPTLGVTGPTTDGDKGITLNGSTQYVTIPDNAAFSLVTTGQMTIEAWVNPVGTTAAAIIAKGAAAVPNWEYKIQRGLATTGAAGDMISFTLWTASGGNRVLLNGTAASAPNGVWTHVAVTIVNNVLCCLYINGRLNGSISGAWTSTSVDGTSTLDFGRRPNNDQYFAGSIKDVAMYSRALGAGEVADHFYAGIGR